MPQTYESSRVTLSFAIEKDVLDQVDTFARREERSRSSMIRMILREWVLEQLKKEKQASPETEKSIHEREKEEVERKAREKDRANRPPTGNVFDIADSDD